MARDQHRGGSERIEILKATGNGNSGVVNVISANLLRGYPFGHRHGTVKIIRVGSSVGRISRPAWAQAVAYSEWVWATPPIPGNAR